MQKSITLRKFIPLIILLLIAAVFALTAGLAHASSAAADGNDAGDHSKAEISIKLDLNGRDAVALSSDDLKDDSKEDITLNDSKKLRKRIFTIRAIVDAYNGYSSTAAADKLGTTNITFVPNSIYIDSKAVTVSFYGTGNNSLVVEALKKTKDARFSVKVNDGTKIRPISFVAAITDTFAMQDETAKGGWSFADPSKKEMRVGDKLNSAFKPANDTLDHINEELIPNYGVWKFSLEDYLCNRALYVIGASQTDYLTPIVMATGGTDLYWSMRSVSNLSISDVKFEGIESAFKNVGNTTVNPQGGSADNGFGPIAKLRLELTTTAVEGYLSKNMEDGVTPENMRKFWEEPHNVKVDLKLIDAESSDKDKTYTILVPIKIAAANPQGKSLDSSVFNMNVKSSFGAIYNDGTPKYINAAGSEVAYFDEDPETGESVSKNGYNSVIIRPSDLIDYCHYGSIAKFYGEGNENYDPGSPTSAYEMIVTEGDKYSPEALKLVLHTNGQFTINLDIEYETDKYITVQIFAVGYGDYEVKFDTLNGTKEHTFNVLTSSLFTTLMADHYQMTAVKSNNPDELEANVSNNILTLKPRTANIDGTARASVTMTFTNVDGQTIEVTSNEFLIDIEAESFWTMFPEWRGWLIIAACILGGLLLILLIVWIFIHSISKHKQEENATAAPVSSYIVRLNSTIAATQAQQRLAATQALSQASATNQMLLGAGPTGTQAPPADTLQLATGLASAPQQTNDSTPSTPPAESEPKEKEEDYDSLIAEYITDEELLERIFTEKYEPKGMVRRTFFKSKDLQARELDKEKKRIIERYKSPMPMDEAIMSEAEIKKAEEEGLPSTPSTPSTPAESTTINVFNLGFDPDAPLYVEKERDEFSDEKIDIDVAPEESHYNDIEHRYDILQKELSELRSRIDMVQKELDKNKSAEDELREKIAKAEADDEKYTKDIEDLEFKLASAKNKDKDRITRDITTNEKKKARNLDNLEKLRQELDVLLNGGQKLNDIMANLTDVQEQKVSEESKITEERDKAKADFDAYQDRLAQVKARQELETKIQGINEMLVAVNNADCEMRALDNYAEKYEKERESLKADIAAAKAQILGANDFDLINELNTRISDANARLSDIEREITKSTKRKSDLNIEFTAQRRNANSYVEKNEIPLEDLIAAEDIVIGDIALQMLRGEREKDREAAEKAVAAAQASFDDVTASSSDITMLAMEVASGIQDLENELATTQAELDAINAQMENATDDEKLMLMVDQGDKSDKIDELNQKIKQANVEGTKRKIDAQAEYDERLEAARKTLDEATEEFKIATAKYDSLVDTNPLDLIISGSGIISQDQKKIEANNLKKQLEKSKNEIEQARLAAQMAQMEAEQSKIDAARATDEARAEAERIAQEAIEKAEAARLEAEERARSQTDAAEQARREAEERAEQAKREAEEAAEQARREAEESAEQARREAEEAAEQARREAEESAEQARREAEEARRVAEEAAEQARRDAEEAMQAEAEEAKRKAQEEIEEMRRKADEEAEAKRQEEEDRRREEEERQKAEDDRKDAIAKKVAARKEKIVMIREHMKDIKGDEDAKNLREQLYTLQLTFDDDERGSVELMDFYNKTMDDIQHAGEIAALKAENAKKPKRIIKKVTERVNRKPKKKARPAARPGARPGAARRPSAAGGARRPSAGGARRPSAGGAPRRPGTRPPHR